MISRIVLFQQKILVQTALALAVGIPELLEQRMSFHSVPARPVIIQELNSV